MLRWELGTHLDFDLVTLVLAFRQEGHRHFCVLTATDEPYQVRDRQSSIPITSL